MLLADYIIKHRWSPASVNRLICHMLTSPKIYGQSEKKPRQNLRGFSGTKPTALCSFHFFRFFFIHTGMTRITLKTPLIAAWFPTWRGSQAQVVRIPADNAFASNANIHFTAQQNAQYKKRYASSLYCITFFETIQLFFSSQWYFILQIKYRLIYFIMSINA